MWSENGADGYASNEAVSLAIIPVRERATDAQERFNPQDNQDNMEVPHSPFAIAVRKTISLALPLTASYILINSRDFLSPRILSQAIGDDAVGAYSLITSAQSLIIYSCHAPLYMISACTGQRFGRGNTFEAGTVLQQGYFLAGLLSIPAMSFFFLAAPIFRANNQSEELIEIANSYFYGYIWGIPAIAWTTCNTQFLSAVQKQKTIAKFALLSFVVDVGLKYALVLSPFEWGAFGLGLANSLQSWLTCLAFATYFYWKHDFRSYFLFNNRLLNNMAVFKEILKTGAPISLLMAGRFSASLITNLIIGRLGKAQLTIHQTAQEYLYLSSPIRMSIGDASEVMVSQCAGKSDRVTARKLGTTTIVVATLGSLLPFVIFTAIPVKLASLFISFDNDETSVVENVFRCVAVIQFFDTIRDVALHALRGINLTKWPAYINLLGSLVVSVVLCVISAFLLDGNLLDLNIASGIGIIFSAMLLLKYWLKKSGDENSFVSDEKIESDEDIIQREIANPPRDSEHCWRNLFRWFRTHSDTSVYSSTDETLISDEHHVEIVDEKSAEDLAKPPNCDPL